MLLNLWFPIRWGLHFASILSHHIKLCSRVSTRCFWILCEKKETEEFHEFREIRAPLSSFEDERKGRYTCDEQMKDLFLGKFWCDGDRIREIQLERRHLEFSPIMWILLKTRRSICFRRDDERATAEHLTPLASRDTRRTKIAGKKSPGTHRGTSGGARGRTSLSSSSSSAAAAAAASAVNSALDQRASMFTIFRSFPSYNSCF